MFHPIPDFSNSIYGCQSVSTKHWFATQEYSTSLQQLPPPSVPGFIFFLQLLSALAVHLNFISVSSSLRSFWRICRASWTVYKYQSSSSSLSQSNLMLLLKSTLETIRHIPSFANRKGNQPLGHAPRRFQSLISNTYWHHKINNPFSVSRGNKLNTRQQKASVALSKYPNICWWS